ncbi:MAG TPA: hypothetical protein VHO70_22005 [Chitinispirillaceae bacterium]|nr:hypothetical protein [Chitinispirillaceae bacterium]
MRLLYTICILLSLLFEMISASDEIRYTADMMHFPVGADIAALGDAGVVLPRRAISAYWNPAASAFVRQYEVSVEGAEMYSGLSRQACATIHAPVQGNTGITLMYVPFYSGKIPRYDSLPGTYQERLLVQDKSVFGKHNGYFRNNQHLVVCSVGKLFEFQFPRLPGISLPLPVEVGLGADIKGFWHMMDPDGNLILASGFNADLGFVSRIAIDHDLRTMKPSRQILIAMQLKNIFPSSVNWQDSYNNYSEPFTFSHQYGLSFVDQSGFLGGNWTVALALKKYIDVSYHAGIEVEYWERVCFRVGLADRVPVIGAGVHLRHFFADYALRFDPVSVSWVRLATGVTFGL